MSETQEPYVLEGSGKPTIWTDEMKSAAMKDAQKVCDLTDELAALRSENEKLKAALETIQNGARSQGPFEGMSWRDVDVICEKVLCQLEEPQATPSDQQGSEVA